MNNKARLQDKGIERTETHLLVGEAQNVIRKLTSDDGLLDLSVEGIPLRDGCNCRDRQFPTRAWLRQGVIQTLMPDSLREILDNHLAVFDYAVRDKNNCCDTFQALQGCCTGLESLIDLMSRAVKLRNETLAAGAGPYWYAVLTESWEAAENWCTVAGRVLRERTAGSFEDLSNQSRSLPSYRGGLQKVLYIADNLLHEFHASIDEPLRHEGDSNPEFYTVYEPKSTIRSLSRIGLIKIPMRYTYALHLVLPQLWHEVGTFLFQQSYPIPFCPTTDRRLQELEKVGKQNPIVRDELMRDTSDLWADWIVLLYGFGGRYVPFARYLTTLYLDAMDHNSAPPEESRKNFAQLALRLFFALALTHCVYYLREKRRSYNDADFHDCMSTFWRDSEEIFLQIYEVIDQEVLSFPRYSKRHDRDLFRRSYDSAWGSRIGSQVCQVFWVAYLQDFTRELSMGDLFSRDRIGRTSNAIVGKWGGIEGGLLVDFTPGDSINQHYLKLYEENLEALLDEPKGSSVKPMFKEMASLGRSAILGFQKRQK